MSARGLPVDVAVVVEVVKALEDVLQHRGDRHLVKDTGLAVLGLHLVLDDVQKTAHFKKPEEEASGAGSGGTESKQTGQ